MKNDKTNAGIKKYSEYLGFSNDLGAIVKQYAVKPGLLDWIRVIRTKEKEHDTLFLQHLHAGASKNDWKTVGYVSPPEDILGSGTSTS